MEIKELRLKTTQLAALRDFYVDTLGFGLLDEDDNMLALDAGNTRLVFEATDEGDPFYHYAFNIPHNQFAEAKTWLAARTPLLTFNGGKDEIDWTAWDARAVYFRDPAGNIGELIARFKLPDASNAPFSAASITEVSEIGLAVEDVAAQCDAMQQALGMPTWDAGDGENFRALGDAHGLFIVVKLGRSWFPTEDRPAGRCPTSVTLRGETARYAVPGLPYTITVAPG